MFFQSIKYKLQVNALNLYCLVITPEDTVEKCIEKLNSGYKSYEIMETLHKLNNIYHSKKDFEEETLNLITGTLLELLNKMCVDGKFDAIIIPYIFNLYKKIFHKQLKESTQDKEKKTNDKGENKKIKDPVQIQKNAEILISFFRLSFLLIVQDENIPIKINIATTTFMHKFIEEGIPIKVNGLKKMVNCFN